MNTSTSLIPSTPCYLNGEFMPLNEARIPVMDRGFIFGDGLYEVVPIYAGRPFRFDGHMARLEGSLKEMRIVNPHSREQWLALVKRLAQLLAEQQGQDVTQLDQIFYLQITRGVAPRDHAMPANITPTVFAMVQLLKPIAADVRQKGVACVSADDFRWEKAHIKSTSLLGAVFSRQISADVGATETIMFRGDYLSEAAASNVWVVKNGKLIGAINNHLVLEGVRYGLIETLCQKAGIAFELRNVHRHEVLDADELILSSATKEILAITTLDGKPVGHGATLSKPGPIYKKLFTLYQKTKKA
ncbi:MAG: D-amino acid aminotransferase [Limnohabitans sp.]|nr:D-amino acid aminotransferase [Limnohabitans sp.]